MKCVIVRYSEIGLKGKNRVVFERKLVSNIQKCLRFNNIPFSRISRPRGRIIVYADQCDCLRTVFGIASFSPAVETAPSLEALQQTTQPMLNRLTSGKSFRVSCQRLSGNLHSREVEQELGAFVQQETNAQVNLKHYDIKFGVELFEDKAFVFTDRIEGFGGLPVGSEGTVLALVENEADVVAALLVMKRGCAVVAAQRKPFDVSLLTKYSCALVKPKPINNIDELDSKIVVVGQTLSNFEKLPIKSLVLRPLITYSEKEIKAMLDEFKTAAQTV